MKTDTNIHLVFGADEYSVEQKAREIIVALVPPSEEAFGLEVLEAASETVDHAVDLVRRCMEAVCTVGFLGQGKVVWLRAGKMLGDSVTARSATVKEKLTELASLLKEGLPDGQTLVITASGVDKRYAFYKACKDRAAITEFQLPDKSYKTDEHARKRVMEDASRLGLRLKADVVEALVARTGADTRQIVNELEKLDIYLAGRREMTLEDVDKLVSVSRETAAWDLADAVGEGNLPMAIRTVRRLLFQKQSPVGLIIGIHRRLQDLAIFRAALDGGWVRVTGSGGWKQATWNPPAEVAEQLALLERGDPTTYNPYRAGRLAVQAQRFSAGELRRLQSLAVEAHERMVSMGVPHPLVLELLLLRMLGPRPARSGRAGQ